MTRKIVDVNHNITPGMERAIVKAFTEFSSYEEENIIKVPQRDHLGSEFAKGMSCDHKWISITQNVDNINWLQKNYDETEIGLALSCSRCGATCLTDNNKIWAYDATTRFFGRPPKEKSRI